MSGTYEFNDQLLPVEEIQNIAPGTRPDLKAAVQLVDQAKTNRTLAVANGSTDPTFRVDFAPDPSIPVCPGVSVSIPLRIFDRNQGEKARTSWTLAATRDCATLLRRRFSMMSIRCVGLSRRRWTCCGPYKARYVHLALEGARHNSIPTGIGEFRCLITSMRRNHTATANLAHMNLTGSYWSRRRK